MRCLILASSLALGVSATSALANPQTDCVNHYNEGRYRLAIEPCTIMAEQGVANFQFILGLMYYGGLGFAQNYNEAVRWYRAAAEQDHADAQFGLGVMYHGGLGAAQNFGEALRWYRAAALKGVAKAQNNLGTMYEYGEGVIQNYVRAHMWYNISAANGAGEIAINNRNRIAALMTPQDIAEAQTFAQRCLDSNYIDC